jgi:hypothetical protein
MLSRGLALRSAEEVRCLREGWKLLIVVLLGLLHEVALRLSGKSRSMSS